MEDGAFGGVDVDRALVAVDSADYAVLCGGLIEGPAHRQFKRQSAFKPDHSERGFFYVESGSFGDDGVEAFVGGSVGADGLGFAQEVPAEIEHDRAQVDECAAARFLTVGKPAG